MYLEMIPPVTPRSEIQEFFDGAVIFITGASGFLGTLLVEKLLRSCPNLSRIYILMREKKGLSSQQRFEKMFKDMIFDRLRKEQPNFLKKVFFISGDCALPNLGLSCDDRKILIKEVSIVFHCAATVKFDEKLRLAGHINVRGTKEMIILAREMINLKAFVHISTAFSNCVYKEVGEYFYKTMDGDKLLRIIEELDTELEAFTPPLIGKWPNTYTFTKAIAENVVAEYGKGLPITVFRPSVVISTFKEPLPGWINNVYGPVGATLGVGLGVLHVHKMRITALTELVPADYCINAIIAAAWQIGIRKNKLLHKAITQGDDISDSRHELELDIPIYNYVSSPENPITWGTFIRTNSEIVRSMPLSAAIWYEFLIPCSIGPVYVTLVFLLHTLPGFIFDTAAVLAGKKPSLREWKFHNNNTQDLWMKLNENDRKLFKFDIKSMDWKEYLQSFVFGLRVYVIKDPLDTVPQAVAKQRKLKIVHYIFTAVLFFVFIKIVWMLF